MRNVLIILLLTISLATIGQSVYYVQDPSDNVNASDLNAGTDIEYPWATWQKAFNTATAGDTVYFRGGTYQPTSKVAAYPITGIDPTSGYGHNGTYDSPICFFAYPDDYESENYPILDCQVASESAHGNTGIQISANWVKFKGLTVCNVRDLDGVSNTTGIGISHFGGYVHLENMTAHHIGGVGITAREYDTVYLKNCDVYYCCDSLAYYILEGDTINDAGGDADGFLCTTRGVGADTTYYTVLEGCRAWNVSDDGFDLSTTKQLYVDDCWTWGNGDAFFKPVARDGSKPIGGAVQFGAGVALGDSIYYGGDAGGWKISYSAILGDGKRWIKNCISAYNGYAYADFNLNSEDFGPRMHYYNNISYKDYLPFSMGPSSWTCYEDPAHVIYRNNIGYDFEYSYDVNLGMLCHITQDHNSWIMHPENDWLGISNPDYTITDDDFVSLDTAQLRWSRKLDGSLPDITFLTLKSTSDLIDGGINVGLPYSGLAPDLGYAEYAPIIADHTVVDKYDDIPQYYLDKVKKMWFSVASESHGIAYMTGLAALESIDSEYDISWTYQVPPEAYTDSHLRISQTTWGDINNESGWIYTYGEDDWWLTSLAISRTKAGITYCHDNALEYSAFGFGHCYDSDYIDYADYISATQDYVDYCDSAGYDTKIFFSTGPTDYSTAEKQYQKYLAWESIRDYVTSDPSLILFDYNDILCYDDGSETPNTQTYDGHTFPVETTNNLLPESSSHISNAGNLRIGKAVWWMLARIAGWDGLSTTTPESSMATDITAFSLTQQTGAATIDTDNHTVSIEVAYGTNVTSLSPSITVSYGGTIDPTSGTARDFTSPVTYTVTAEDEVTEQEWTVTVTVGEEEPATSPVVTTGGKLILHNGKWVRL